MKTQIARWKASDLIQNLKTGKVYMVLQLLPGYATIVAPMDQTELPPTQSLFTRDYDHFAKMTDVIEKDGKYTPDIISL